MTSQDEKTIRTNVLAGIRIDCTKNTHRVQHLALHLYPNPLADEKLAEDANSSGYWMSASITLPVSAQTWLSGRSVASFFHL